MELKIEPLSFCLLQKIMHTKKRHQNMLQDLNRKLHHAEKDRESPASDSKVTATIFLSGFYRKWRKKKNSGKNKLRQ